MIALAGFVASNIAPDASAAGKPAPGAKYTVQYTVRLTGSISTGALGSPFQGLAAPKRRTTTAPNSIVTDLFENPFTFVGQCPLSGRASAGGGAAVYGYGIFPRTDLG